MRRLVAALGAALLVALPAPGARAQAAEDEAGPIMGIPAPDGSAPELTLDDCVRNALEGNADLEHERQRETELRGQGWQAASLAVPSFDVSGTWSRSRDPSFLLDESFSGSDGAADSLAASLGGLDFFPDPDDLEAQSFWRSSVGSEWELNPFRLVNSLQGVDVRLRQHFQDVKAVEHRVIEQSMTAFFEVELHQERIRAIEADIDARREFLDVTRRRYALELATELDTLQAAVSLANLKPALRRVRTDLTNASSRLNILMGRDALEPIALIPTFRVERDPVDPQLVQDLAMRRPDLESARLQVRFLEKRRGVVRADQRPSLLVDGRYGYVARTAEDLVDRENDFWSANVTLSVPFFDGFYTKGRVMETEGLIAQARTGLADAERQATLEVATAREELEAARENLDAAELNLRAADRAFEQMSFRYELGKAKWLDVLNVQSDRFVARRTLITARYNVLAQTATLKRALGLDPRTPLSRLGENPEGTTP